MNMSKKAYTWLYVITLIALVGLLIWGINIKNDAKALELNNENSYNRAFSDLVDYMDNIDVKLTKAQLAHTPAQLASISNDIFSESSEAKSALAQLPTSQVHLEATSKFLSQVGDYTYVLSQSMINGEEISQDQYDTLAKLNDYASELKDNLKKIQEEIYSGNSKLSQMSAKVSDNTVLADGQTIIDSLSNIEKSFDGYPSLIYDGPFSEHIENQKPAMLENLPTISESEALNAAKEFLGDKGRNLSLEGSSENTQIPAYNFSAATGNSQISISVTKQGGYILYYLDSTSITEERINIETAISKASEFLQSRGIYNMQNSYYDKSNNIATINFAYSQNGIICYSDLIKVRVGLDNGAILGFESKGYLMNHKERDLSEPKISKESAREIIAPNLNVTPSGLALIPKDSLKEVLCYEFKGNFKGKNFIIYINADNGREEKIFLLLESENGVLTV